MKERRAYLVLVAISVVLSLSVWILGVKELQANNHKFCQLISVSLQSATVKTPPSNPKAKPAQETLYKDYVLVHNLGRSLGCI